ncbi:MAG: hypothetical protein ACI4FN_07695 [Acutalibacteraceae bacterium]
MKKLGSVESIEDFILAIAGGADVNGTWKGGPLIEHYFTEAMRHIVIYPDSHPKSKPDINMQKLQAMITAGADVAPLFSSEYEYYEYGNLVRLITRRLELLKIVLSSKKAQGIVSSDSDYMNDLKALDKLTQWFHEMFLTLSVPDKKETGSI